MKFFVAATLIFALTMNGMATDYIGQSVRLAKMVSTAVVGLYEFYKVNKAYFDDNLKMDEALLRKHQGTSREADPDVVDSLRKHLHYAFDAYFDPKEDHPSVLTAVAQEDRTELVQTFISAFPYAGGYVALNRKTQQIIVTFRGADSIKAHYHTLQPILVPWEEYHPGLYSSTPQDASSSPSSSSSSSLLTLNASPSPSGSGLLYSLPPPLPSRPGTFPPPPSAGRPLLPPRQSPSSSSDHSLLPPLPARPLDWFPYPTTHTVPIPPATANHGVPTTPEADHSSQLKVHQGFLASFKVTAAQILTVVQNLHAQYPHYHLDVVGQSLGGVHATMLATHLGEGRQAGTLLASSTRITLTHYGRPRVGNLAFVHHFRSLNLINRRVTSRNDLVSRIPFRHLGFVHENDEYWLDTHGKTWIIEGADTETDLGNGGTKLGTDSIYWHNDIYDRSIWENPLKGTGTKLAQVAQEKLKQWTPDSWSFTSRKQSPSPPGSFDGGRG